MKRVILTCAAFALVSGVYAQTDTSQNRMNRLTTPATTTPAFNQQQMDMKHTDGVMMSDGKMIFVKNGKMTFIKRQVTLKNGTKVMADGTCIRKDGTKVMLKDNEHMDMQGNMIPMRESRNK